MSETPWKRAKGQKYQRQEQRTARKRGARAQVNSGRTWSSLRDVRESSPVAHILIDNKTTDELSFRLEKSKWEELKRDANRTPPGCTPALQIDIREISLRVIEESLWDATMDYIRLLEEQLAKHEN